MSKKKTWLLLLLFFTAIWSQAQKKKSDKAETITEISLIDALKKVTKLHGTNFVYERKLLVGKKVSVSEKQIRELPVEEVLKLIVYPNKLLFLYVDKNYYTIVNQDSKTFITAESNTPSTGVIPASAIQSAVQQVSGFIYTAEGTPLEGCTIAEKNSSNKAITTSTGFFTLKVSSSPSRLTFSHIGFELKEMDAVAGSNITVNLTTANKQIQDVVVTGYQSYQKNRTTGSFELLKQDDLQRRITTNILEKINGLVPGVNLENGIYKIRGTSTFYANNNPLYVIDGFPVEQNINAVVSSDDVESITFLKDAASSAIWGVRASNGVIVITTKSGKIQNKKTEISFYSNLALQKAPDFNTMPIATTKHIVDLEFNSLKAGLFSRVIDENSYFSLVEEVYENEKRGRITPAEAVIRLDKLRGNNLRNYQNDFVRESFNQEYNLALKGGANNVSYYFSGAYNKNLPTLIGNKDDRINLNFKMDLRLTSRLKFFINNTTTFRNSSNNPISWRNLPQYQALRDDAGNFLPVYTEDLSQLKKNQLRGFGYLNWNYNPIQDQAEINDKSRFLDSRIQTGFEYTITDGIRFSTRFQNEFSSELAQNINSVNSYQARGLYNFWTSYVTVSTPTGPRYDLTKRLPLGGIYRESNARSNVTYVRNQLDINKTLGKNRQHNITAFLGTELRKIVSESTTPAPLFGYNEQSLASSDISFESALNFAGVNFTAPERLASRSFTDNRFVSFYSDVNYSLKGKYFASASARIDQTNLFGTDPKYRYKPLWSAGLAWNISNESFFKVKHIDFLKLRATYGFNGNVDDTYGPFLKVFAYSSSGFSRARIIAPANPTLRWEQTAVGNLAIDFKAFQSRLSGSIEVYFKKSTDLLGDIALDPTFGFPIARLNTASLRNNGFEFNINYSIIQQKNFNWNVGWNFATNNNQVLKSFTPNSTAINLLSGQNKLVDKPISAQYAYSWAGLSATGNPRVYDKDGKVVDGLPSNLLNVKEELLYVGQTSAPQYGGLTSFFSYKSLSVNAVLVYKFGNVFRRPTINYTNDIYGKGLIHEDLDKRWVNPGDENRTSVPAYPTSRNDQRMIVYLQSDHLVEKGSFIRLSELSLNWQLPNVFLNRIGVKNASLQIQGNNLGLLWKANKKGIDPENTFGPLSMPLYRVGFRINL